MVPYHVSICKKERKEMDYKYDGYCGLFCGACPLLLAGKAGGGPNPCHGCKSDHPAGHCTTCAIKVCAEEKGFSFCYECSELGDCTKMREFMADPKWPYHQAVLSNFEAMQRNGLEKWLAEQDERWRCPSCHAPHSWWDETCSACGRAVANYRADLDRK